jgi:hypothetical protein
MRAIRPGIFSADVDDGGDDHRAQEIVAGGMDGLAEYPDKEG